MPETDPLAALRQGFDIEDKRPERQYFILTCKVCKARWSLAFKSDGSIHVGNILHLMNHEASHD